MPETSEAAKLETFGLAADDRMPYQVTNRSLVPLVFENLELGPDDVFVDFGCGKGRVVLAAASLPVKRVVGVDISPELCAVARENVQHNLSSLACKEVEIVATDATTFEVPDDMTVAYMYNPFKGEIFEAVLNNIIASWKRNPRRITLAYLLPTMEAAVLATGVFTLTREVRFGEGDSQRLALFSTDPSPEAAPSPPAQVASPASPPAEPAYPVRVLEVDERDLGEASADERAVFYRVAAGLESTGFFGSEEPPPKEWALIALDDYEDADAFLRAARHVHGGNAVRDARKAGERGYVSEFFAEETFVGDIAEVDQSAAERQGGPMADHYRRTVDERGGFPTEYMEAVEPRERLAWDRFFGVFRPEPGRRQGEVVVDRKLLAYVKLRRLGPFMFYGTILGHADHLREGVVYKMHLDLMTRILRNRERLERGEPDADRSLAGAGYLGYARYFNQGEGLLMWKKRMLFEPSYVILRYPRQAE